jgi:Fe2+ transport system protein FeoA
LLLSHGLVCRVRTIEVAVHPLGGDNFKIRLDATKPSVGEAKVEIARVQGTEEARQELYVLGPVPGVDVMAKRPQGLLNVGTLSARIAVLRSCALDM